MSFVRYSLIAAGLSFVQAELKVPPREAGIRYLGIKMVNLTNFLEVPDATFVVPPSLMLWTGDTDIPNPEDQRVFALVQLNVVSAVRVDGGVNIKYCFDVEAISRPLVDVQLVGSFNAVLDSSQYPGGSQVFFDLEYDEIDLSELKRAQEAFRNRA